MNSSCACVFPFKYNGRTYSDCTHVDHTQLWCPQKVNSKGEWAPPMAWGECATVCPRPCKSHGNCDARHYCGVQGKGKPPNCESCHFCAGRRDGVGGTCPTKCHGASAWDNVLVKDCNGHQSPASWVGDGVCDAKTFDHGGVKVLGVLGELRRQQGAVLQRLVAALPLEGRHGVARVAEEHDAPCDRASE